jgi:hypothetical protein
MACQFVSDLDLTSDIYSYIATGSDYWMEDSLRCTKNKQYCIYNLHVMPCLGQTNDFGRHRRCATPLQAFFIDSRHP